jgi:hypothetical protein
VPRLSIVIPCIGGAAEFDGTLVSVLQNRPADCEVLVVHTAPYDDPYSLRSEVRFIESRGGSLCELLNPAIDEAVGEVLHVVGCGLEVTENWTVAAMGHFNDPEVAAVSPVVFKADRKTLAAAGVYWSIGGARRVVTDRRIISPGSGRLRARIHGPTLAAAFYRRDVLVALGGFDVALGDGLADASVALDIQALGRLHVCEPGSQIVRTNDHVNAELNGLAGGRAAERLFWRHAIRRGLSLSVGLHTIAIAADAVRSGRLVSLVGRGLGGLEFGAAMRQERRLAEANERLKELSALRAVVRKTSKTAPTARRRAA